MPNVRARHKRRTRLGVGCRGRGLWLRASPLRLVTRGSSAPHFLITAAEEFQRHPIQELGRFRGQLFAVNPSLHCVSDVKESLGPSHGDVSEPPLLFNV